MQKRRRSTPTMQHRKPWIYRSTRSSHSCRTRGKLSNTDLARGRRLAEESGDEILRMLVRLGLVSERDMAQAFSQVMDLPLAEAADFPEAPVASETLSLRFLKDARVLPLREDETELAVALADPGRPVRLQTQ